MSSAPRFAPSSLNCTPATPTLSAALAVTMTLPPVTVAPLAGAVIDTAGTVSEASYALKKMGAKDVYVCATHALLSGPARDRLIKAPIKEVAVTNTIAISEHRAFDKLTVLSVGELLAKAVRLTHAEQSVSSLFEEQQIPLGV